MPAGNIGDLRIVHQFDQILLHFPGEEILIGQNQKDLPLKRRKIRFGHGLLMHQVGKQAGNMHILFLLVIFEDRLKHILRAGDLLCAFIADMAHARLYELRLQLFRI